MVWVRIGPPAACAIPNSVRAVLLAISERARFCFVADGALSATLPLFGSTGAKQHSTQRPGGSCKRWRSADRSADLLASAA